MNKKLLLSLVAYLIATEANAEDLHKISVKGNSRVENDTIITHSGFKIGQDINQNSIDVALKKLYGTGLFKDIKVHHKPHAVEIELVENPMIYNLVIEGNKRIKSEDIVSELSLSPRSILNKNKIQSDVLTIQRLYQKNGRYYTQITPKVIELKHNRVNLVYEVEEGPKTLIGKIEFIGNKNVSSGKLKDIVISKESKWFRFLSETPKLDLDRVSYDKELINRFYLSRGYADVVIKEPVVELNGNNNTFTITYVISEGKVYKFGDISLESEIENLPLDNLTKFIETKKGKTFDNSQIEKTVKNLNDQLGDIGYAFVDIEPVLEKESEVVNIKYVINKAPKYYVDKINIKGNVRTFDKVIRREIKIAEGDAYKTSAVNDAEKRIRDLDYFETVTVDVEPNTQFEDKVDVNIEVKEKSTGHMNFAAGVSDVQGAIGKVSFRERNFTGRGQDIDLSFLKSRRDTDFVAEITDPYFMDKDFSVGVMFENFHLEKTKDRSFSRRGDGGKIGFGYYLTDNLNHSMYYRLRKDHISNVDINTSQLLKEQQGRNTLSMIGQRFTYSTLDSKTYPTKGINLALSQDLAGLGGNSAFIRHEIRSSYYVPVYREDVVLSFQANYGIVHSLRSKKVLLAERFFMGGTEVRGFKDYGIGPRDRLTEDALGGNMYYSGRVQLSVPLGLPKELDMKGLIFNDFGGLSKLDYKNYSNIPRSSYYDINKLRAAYGVGLAWDSPLGMIGLSVAKAYKKESYDKVKTFRFTIMSEF